MLETKGTQSLLWYILVANGTGTYPLQGGVQGYGFGTTHDPRKD